MIWINLVCDVYVSSINFHSSEQCVFTIGIMYYLFSIMFLLQKHQGALLEKDNILKFLCNAV